MIDGKKSDERYQIGENEKEILNKNIEFSKPGKLISKRYIDYIDK